MIRLAIAGAALLSFATVASAQMTGNSSTTNGMGDMPEAGMKTPATHKAMTHRSRPMKKKMPAKGTSHNGRSGMPASGTDSSMPMGNSMSPGQ